jgi:hypothetical protein
MPGTGWDAGMRARVALELPRGSREPSFGRTSADPEQAGQPNCKVPHKVLLSLVGPKPRAYAVGDGWPVDIPALVADVTSNGGTRREGHRAGIG